MSRYKFLCAYGMLFFSKTFFIASAQNALPLKFEHITSDQGLSNRNTLSMFKDSKGFLWITTIDGVNRYDGYEFKIFRNNPYDSTTISKGWPGFITEDKNGTIWIACSTPQGLNAYNPITGKFKRYCDDPFYKNILPDNTMGFIFPDEKNCLWMSTQGDGLLKFDPSTNKSIYFRHDSLDKSSLHSDDFTSICQADSGHLYIATEGGFDLFDMDTGKCRYFIAGSGNDEVSVNYIFKDSKNNLWLCTNEGLKMFDPVTEKITEYRHNSNDYYSISSDTLFSICETPDGKLWLTTSATPDGMSGTGLNVFDPQMKIFFHYRHDDADPFSISSDILYGILYDPSGKVWIQADFGLNAVNLLPDKFESFKHNEKDENSIRDNAVQYIFQDKQGKIFVCFFSGKGVDVFDEVRNIFENYQPDEKVNKYFRESRIDFMFEDRDGNYWVEADFDKLILFNPVTHHTEVFHYHENHHPDSLGVGYIFGAHQDSAGLIWFGGEYHLSSFNPSTGKFKNYLVDPSMPRTDINQVAKLYEFGDGKIWMTTANGPAYFDRLRDTIFVVKYSKNDAAKNVSNHAMISSLVESKNKLWVGTMGQGLFLLDLITGECVNFNTNDGLPNDVVWAVLKDSQNNLWLPTNNGICKFTPSKSFLGFSDKEPKGIFRNYNTSDGIPAKEFGWNAFCKLQNGSMLFGMYALSGLVRFYPDSLRDNKFIPPVYITHFSVFNNEVIPSDTNSFLHSTIETTKEIILSYQENVFAFGFAALSFVHPENNKYAYMLEGFDNDWIYTDATKRFANYTNIDAGEYIFKVKACNNDGVWNEKGASVKLIITPPFWKTWWFRILAIATILGAVYAFFRNRFNQLKRLQLIRDKIASDLHDDIGSTLSSISIFTELAKKQSKEITPLLDQISDHSKRMLDSMADIVWTINPENDNFEKIILRMRSLAYDLLGAKNIEFEFNADESTGKIKLPMTVRKNLYLIFKEAANNMAKYSEASRALFSITYNDKQLKFLIRDNGKGFDFDTVIATEKSSGGNGLNNMLRRAKEIGAQISIESLAGTGTFIELLISI